jgi:hypothetical protein
VIGGDDPGIRMMAACWQARAPAGSAWERKRSGRRWFLRPLSLSRPLGQGQARLEKTMTEPAKPWDGQLVRTWLERRCEAARLDQAAADRRGYEARDDYDLAAAEEWTCRALRFPDRTADQATFARRIKDLIAQDDYPVTGIHDDRRVHRNVRAHLRKLAKMTKANEGFGNTLRYQ